MPPAHVPARKRGSLLHSGRTRHDGYWRGRFDSSDAPHQELEEVSGTTRRYRGRRAGGCVRDVPERENHGAVFRHPAQSDLGAWIRWACNDPQHGLEREHVVLAGSLPMSRLRTTVPAMRKFVNSTRLMTSLSTSNIALCLCMVTPDNGSPCSSYFPRRPSSP